MLTRKSLFVLLTMVIVLLSFNLPVTAQYIPVTEPDLQIIGYTLVESKRVTMTTYDYTFVAHVKNNGSAAENVTASLVAFPASVTVSGDVNLSFGNISDGATATSNETFTIRRLMTAAYNDADLLFAFDYDHP